MDFARGSTKFTIIVGANGAGKTNLMNALTWCLFGKELHVDKKYKGLPITNTTAIDEAGDSPVETEVEVQFIQSDGKKILIRRQECFKKSSSGKLMPFPTPNPFTIMFQGERDWIGPICGGDAQDFVNKRIPPNLEEYFFFDGERMDHYFTETTGAGIKKAVFQISQLELLESLIYHLSVRRKEFLRSAKGLSSEVKDIRETIEILNRSLEVDNEQLEELETKKSEARLNEQLFSDKLKGCSLEHIQNLEEQRVDLEADLLMIKGNIIEYTENKTELLHSYMPSIFCYSALLKSKNIIDNKEKEDIIPPLIRSIFVEGLLKKGKCICGSDISEKDEFCFKRRKSVEKFLEVNKLSEMSNDIIETNYRLAEMLNSLEDFPREVVDIGKRLRVQQELKEEKNKKIRRITEEIEQSNLENIKEWEKKRQEFAKKRRDFELKIEIKKRDIKRRKNIIKANEIKLRRELKKQKQHQELMNKLNFCAEAIQAAQKIKEQIMNGMKIEIEKKTSEQFLNLIWKEKTYQGVRIDDDYNISVPHVTGREALGTLSAGERQVCALAFMAALNSVSGFEVPIIIDTLLARISSEPRKNIAKNLPKYLEKTQVVLLVTEEEYTPQVEKVLSKHVGKKYGINFIEKEHGGLAEVEITK